MNMKLIGFRCNFFPSFSLKLEEFRSSDLLSLPSKHFVILNMLFLNCKLFAFPSHVSRSTRGGGGGSSVGSLVHRALISMCKTKFSVATLQTSPSPNFTCQSRCISASCNVAALVFMVGHTPDLNPFNSLCFILLLWIKNTIGNVFMQPLKYVSKDVCYKIRGEIINFKQKCGFIRAWINLTVALSHCLETMGNKSRHVARAVFFRLRRFFWNLLMMCYPSRGCHLF